MAGSPGKKAAMCRRAPNLARVLDGSQNRDYTGRACVSPVRKPEARYFTFGDGLEAGAGLGLSAG
jgi:hypothetical protein